MKHWKHIYCHPFFFFCFLFNNASLCSEYDYAVTIHMPIQPLSERGVSYLKKTAWKIEAAQHGFYASKEQSGYTTEINDHVTVGMQRGTCIATTSCGDYTVTAGIDILSTISVIPVLFEAVCRFIDINGKYYRQDKKKYREAILYEADKKRCDIYVKSSNYDAYYAQQKDIEYLRQKLDEFELSIKACSKQRCARHAAMREAQECIQRSLRFVESQQCVSVAEQHCITNPNCSKKEDAQELKKSQYIQDNFTKSLYENS